MSYSLLCLGYEVFVCKKDVCVSILYMNEQFKLLETEEVVNIFE